MENFESTSIFALSVDAAARENLLSAGKWARFIGITVGILMGLVVLVLLVIGAAFPVIFSKLSPGASALPSGFMMVAMIFYAVIIVGIYFYPLYALIKFGALMKSALAVDSQEKFNASLSYLKGHLKYIGILLIIGLAFYALVIVLVLGAGLMSRF